MKNLFIILIMIFSYLKIYISISKIFKLKYPFNILENATIPILLFEILTILLFYINPNLYVIIPTSVQFITFGVQIYHITLYSIFYLLLNTVFIITTLGLNDTFIPIYNYGISIHFILTSIFTILLL